MSKYMKFNEWNEMHVDVKHVDESNSNDLNDADLITESKRSKEPINLVFLSGHATMDKLSPSAKYIMAECEKQGVNFIPADCRNCELRKNASNDISIIDDRFGTEYHVSPLNTVILPRKTILDNTHTRDILSQFEDFGFFVINQLDAFESCENKYVTYRKLKTNGVSTPRTVIVQRDDIDKLEEKVNKIGGNFPIVGKVLAGTQGVGVFIIESMMSLRSVLQTMFAINPNNEFILQEKINSKYDLRIHVLNDSYERIKDSSKYRTIGIMQRNQVKGDFRTNVHLGGSSEQGYATPEQLQLAYDAAKACNCRWCGVDLITDEVTGKSYIIEINTSPGT